MLNILLPILLIVCPDSLQPYLGEYIQDREFNYTVVVCDTASPADYVLLINQPIRYDVIPIWPYLGVMATTRTYGDKVGVVMVNNGQELTNVLTKFINYIPRNKVLLIGSRLDDKTDGVDYKRKIFEPLPHYPTDSLWYNFSVRAIVDKISENTLVNHMGHSNSYGFDHVAYNMLNWFTNTGNVLIYSGGCYAGNYAKELNVARMGLATPNCWASFIGGTNYMFYMIGGPGGVTYRLDSLFWDNYEHYRTISDVLKVAKDSMPPINPDDFNRWMKSAVNIQGDPTLTTLAGINFQCRGEVTGGMDEDTITFTRDTNFRIRTVVRGGEYRIECADLGEWTVTSTTRSTATPKDGLACMLYSIGLKRLTPLQKVVMDVNGDGVVNSADALMISRHFVGLLKEFPVGESMIFETVNISRLHTTQNLVIHQVGKL